MNQDRAEGHRCFCEDMVLGTDAVNEKRARARIKTTSKLKAGEAWEGVVTGQEHGQCGSSK